MGDVFWDGAINFIKNAQIYEDMLTEKVYTVVEDPPIYVKEGNHRIIIENQNENYESSNSYVYEVNTSLVKDSKGPLGLMVAYEDTCEIKKLQDELTQIENLAVPGELAASAVHEIKNPLFSIRGFLQLLENSLSKDDRRREYTHIMVSELDRLHRLVDEFLIISKGQGKNCNRINVKEMIEEVIGLFKPRFDLQQISCHVETDSDSMMIMGDKDQLKQVFINLIQNSLDAMSPERNIYIKAYTKGKKVHIKVTDEGTGIRDEDKNKLFSPFFTTKEKGTGLGLYITKKIVSNHDGKIGFNSKEGEGTTFFLEFPCSE